MMRISGHQKDFRVFHVLLIAILLAAAGCGGGDNNTDISGHDTTTPDTIDPDVSLTDTVLDTNDRDEYEPPDTTGETLIETIDDTTGTDETSGDALADTADAEIVIECPGNFSCPCDSASECFSGMCVETMYGSVCSRNCGGSSSCPAGWACTNINQTGGDPVYGCVDSFPKLCRPCRTDMDCVPTLGAGNRIFKCVEHDPETGSFCGAECLNDRECPEGFICSDFGQDDDTYTQCVPEDGVCPCTDYYMDMEYATVCSLSNEFGTCEGERTCDAACDAPSAAAEICNNMDDDCDDVTDEDVLSEECPLTNTIGTCTGHTVCTGGNKICQGAYAVVETCNDKDDDCDGIIDNGLGTTTCGTGVCLHTVENCIDGDTTVCNPMEGATTEICDGLDNDCDGITDNGFTDTDQDTIRDCVDDDDDGDTVPDETDNCQWTRNLDQLDMDGDDIGDACDCDIDGDGTGNTGLDFDNQACPTPDPEDNCPNTFNPDQADLNLNNIGDACEDNYDDDDFLNEDDNCPWVANNDQADMDLDLIGDACDCDIDGDGVFNTGFDYNNEPCVTPAPEDNCPFVANEGQENRDEDQHGDACDCDQDNDGDPNDAWGCTVPGTDCAPLDPEIHNGAVEICNDIDDDCDSLTDEGCDDDDDDYCDKNMTVRGTPSACPNGGDDCNDNDFAVNPGAAEICNNVDDDCSGGIDNGLGSTTCGLGQCVHTVANCINGETQTCNPMQGATPEICDDIDNDCDGSTDEGCDDDGDDYCDRNMTVSGNPSICPLGGDDCNDGNDQINPGAVEICNNVDDDCDGGKDEDLGSTTCGLGVCVHTVDNCSGGIEQVCDPLLGSSIEICDGMDNDCDGSTDEGCDDDDDDYCDKNMATTGNPAVCPNGGNDCNDQNFAVNPGQAESCNLVDDNCNGSTDENLGTTTCGKGVCEHTINNCIGGVTQVCNPFEDSEPESCDGLDNDCDGSTDESLGTITCGTGVCLHTIQACISGEPQVCNPMEGATTEICDGLDNDCDGSTDEGCDDDGDDYCDKNMGTSGNPAVCPNGGNDCDDGNFSINPGVAETCNNIDDNCNNIIDDGISSAIDGYESNNSCQTALDLGTFVEDATARSFSASIYPSGDADYYIGYFDEAGGIDCFPFTDQDYRVKIVLTPPSGSDCVNYHIVILDNSCNEKARTTASGCAVKTLTWDWDGACGSDDSETYRFAIVPNSTSDWECVGYTMTVEMDAI